MGKLRRRIKLTYNPIMQDRTRLHELVDTLPDDALDVAQGALEHWQTWPPQEPPQARAIREDWQSRMRQGIRTGSVSGSGGGGRYNMGPGGRIGYGHHSHSWWDGDTVVIETHRFHAGHELVVEERLRLADDGTKLVYVHSVNTPGGTADAREIGFDVKKD
jgi:hypothetical protein